MNTIWSDYIQSIGTLYYSRMLRFSDIFKETYIRAFGIEQRRKILEIGCGPGALSQSLARWYPQAEVLGIDRDTAFVEFAAKQAPAIQFMEADATELPFEDESFDVTISNTVQEHIEPSKFFGEQFRVLKPGGICLVLSARRGVHITADCIKEQSKFEAEIWNRVEKYFKDNDQSYQVGQYYLSESQLPATMEQYGFHLVSTDYVTINLTPDNPEISKEMAYAMIDAGRREKLDNIEAFPHCAPGIVTEEEMAEMKKQIHQKYDKRMELYQAGKKQWDTNMSLTMVLRGVK